MREWLQKKAGDGHKVAEYLMLAPDLFHLLAKLLGDEEVPKGEKAKLGAAMTYFVMPVDLIPELISGYMGFADDVALAIYVIHSMINTPHFKIAEKHWSGDQELLPTARNFVKKADTLLGSKMLVGKIRQKLTPPKAEKD